MALTTTSRTRSVYKDTDAGEYIEWLNRIWNSLTDEQKASAYMDARPCANMVMVGLKYADESSSTREKP